MIGLVIKQVRKEKKLTQQEVADRGELSVSCLSKIEQLLYCPSVDTLISIGRGLGVPASELLRQIEPEEREDVQAIYMVEDIRQLLQIIATAKNIARHAKAQQEGMMKALPIIKEALGLEPKPGGLGDLPELLAQLVFTLEQVEPQCRVCGCTDNYACEGGCWWVEPDLCSNCAQHSAKERTGGETDDK